MAGQPKIVDIGLGAYPPGSIRLELFSKPGSTVPDETLGFVIVDLPQIQIFPPPPRPLTDYSELWWAAGEAGWGLSVHQSPLRTLAAAWFVHDASGQPVWFTLQPGNWTNPTTYTGPIYRTTEPFYGGVFNPALVNSQQAATGTLNFEQRPGRERRPHLHHQRHDDNQDDHAFQVLSGKHSASASDQTSCGIGAVQNESLLSDLVCITPLTV